MLSTFLQSGSNAACRVDSVPLTLYACGVMLSLGIRPAPLPPLPKTAPPGTGLAFSYASEPLTCVRLPLSQGGPGSGAPAL